MTNIFFLAVVSFFCYLTLRSWRHAGIALGLIWSMYALEQFLQFANVFFMRRGTLVNFTVVIIAIAAIARSLLSGRQKSLSITREHLWWGGLMLLTAASTYWSICRYSDEILFDAAPYIFGFAIVGPFCAYDDQQLDKAIQTSIYFGGLVLLGMLYCSFGNRSLILGTDSAGKVIEGNPLALASYGGYVTICCVFSIYRNRVNVLAVGLQVAIAVLGLYMIVRSGSRGQLAAAVISCGIWVPIASGVTFKKSNIVLLILASVVFFIGVSFTEDVGMTKRWTPEKILEARDGRMDATMILLKNYTREGTTTWLFGLGSSASYQILGIYPHFVPGEVLAEEGLLGFILFSGFLLLVTATAWKILRSKNIKLESRINICTLLTLFTFEFGLCLKQGNMLGTTGLFCIGLCIAVSGKRILADSRKNESKARMPSQFIHVQPPMALNKFR